MKPSFGTSTSKNILYFIAGLLGINLIILIHEAGHFLLAQFFNVPTPVFSLGFGPALLVFSIGKTLFKLAILPIGGYVEIDQEILAKKAYLVKILIILGGVVFNFLFAYGILLYYTVSNYFNLTTTIDSIKPDSPAAKAGLQPQDNIVAYNHQSVEDAQAITDPIALSYGKTIILTIQRNGIEHEIPISLTHDHPLFGKKAGWLGIELTKKEEKMSMFETTQNICRTFSKTIATKKKDRQNVFIGPIGIIALIGKSLSIDPKLYWFILAIVSLNIGLLNVLPLPFFDGGKALIITIEALFNISISHTIIEIISYIFLILFVLFIAQVTMQDIKKLRE